MLRRFGHMLDVSLLSIIFTFMPWFSAVVLSLSTMYLWLQKLFIILFFFFEPFSFLHLFLIPLRSPHTISVTFSDTHISINFFTILFILSLNLFLRLRYIFNPPRSILAINLLSDALVI